VRIAESVCGPPGALLLEAKINLFGAPDIVVGFSAIPEAFLWADFADGKICRPLRDVANMQTRFRYQKPDGNCSDLFLCGSCGKKSNTMDNLQSWFGQRETQPGQKRPLATARLFDTFQFLGFCTLKQRMFQPMLQLAAAQQQRILETKRRTARTLDLVSQRAYFEMKTLYLSMLDVLSKYDGKRNGGVV
jgi:hypothetical protein